MYGRTYRVGRVVMTLLTLLLVSACSTGLKEEVHFHRLEKLLYNTPPDALPDSLMAHRSDYDTPLLNINPTDSELYAFVTDPSMRAISRIVDSVYGDLAPLEQELGRALARQPWLHYKGFYTLVTGDFFDYSRRVFCSRDELALSLDHYCVQELHAGLPKYIEQLSKREYMAADCLAAIARANIESPQNELTLLDYAILEGKTIYFLEKTLPHTHDTIILRYTTEQLKWMRDNEGQVWAWILDNDLLYRTVSFQMRNLIDDAPQTNVFGNGSAPRTVAYLGWRIVRQYAKRTGISMQELFSQTDSREILTTSAWRPGKR